MKLRDWFHNQSIQRKLSSITALVLVAALLPTGSVMLGYEYHAIRKAALEEVQIQADIIRNNAAAAVAFQDPVAATEVLGTLRASPSIAKAMLFLPDGSAFAHYTHAHIAPGPLPPEQRADSATASWKSILVVRSVHLKSQMVGWLLIQSSLDAFYVRMQLYAAVVILCTLAGLALAQWLARRLIARITEPLSRLVALTHHVADQKDYTLRETVESTDEIGDLSQAFNTMLSHIHERDVRLNQLAYYDSVTGLANRHYFKERAEQAVGNALRYGSRCCLMFIDLDRFKAVNDGLGHDVGDELLQGVAQRLSRTLRNNDVVCRIGGDEFAVILENVKNLSDVAPLAQKMINALTESFLLRGQNVSIGASIGISACPEHADSMAELLRCADIAMYMAKSQGRGQYCFYRADFEVPSP
ncbi:diguanylate cyclase domain-containing protein [Acidovorax facilis]|uniref:diguanylate cyclase domain-containing protein n=1 Tax=Acidovorax facilis TaxID=12917 RepID=UPI003CF3EDE0